MPMDTRTFYDRISGAYDLLADASEGACREQGLRMLDVQPGERVLEVGFGTGHAITMLASTTRASGQVVGIDVSSGMLGVARRRVESAAVGNLSFVLSDARALCFPDHVFDASFVSFTLELFELADIAIVLREVGRVLRPMGRLGIVAMAETDDSNAMIDIYKWLHRHFPHFVDCRPINVPQHLERAGFRVTGAQSMAIWGLAVLCALAAKGRG